MRLSLICCTLAFLLSTVYSEPVTESGINTNYVFDNPFTKNLQNRFDVNKPSKLRLYLLADLAKAADMKQFISNCDSAIELKITSKNCTCSNYSCRYYKLIKKVRILDRNCEDVCCGKQRSRGKSLDAKTNQKRFATITCGEIIPDKNNDVVAPWIVHVQSKGHQQCLGAVLSHRAIITSSSCVENENTTVIQKIESNASPQFKVKEILTSNVIKNSAILVLNKSFNDTDLKQSPCIPQDELEQSFTNCHLGLSNGLGVKVKVVDCLNTNTSQNLICAKFDTIVMQKVIRGAPLFCSLDANLPNSYQILGTYLTNQGDIYIFDALFQIKSMITKYLYNLM